MSEDANLMEKIVSLCKRRGFVFPSSEIYGGFAAVYDFGPLGVELENNIKQAWWKTMVHDREDVVGLDSAIFMLPKVWEASGHVSGFSDPLTECKKCHSRHRVDHMLEAVGVFADEKMNQEEVQKIFDENLDKLECPKCKAKDFTPVRKFNLLVQSNLGNFTGDWTKEPVYLRGETCQGIYVNYKNVLDSMHVKVPFGIAQIGKAFRNEITARQFIFRTREFEQMEMQYFVHPDDAMKYYDQWKERRMQFYVDLGIKPENLQWHKHENLVFYAKEAYDIEYNYPFGWKELEGVHARGDYDLTQHAEHSKQKLEYMDQEKNEKYVPHVVETSAGVARTLLAVLCEAYNEEEVEGDTRVVLKLHPKLAPYKIAVLPLSKKDELIEPAREILLGLKKIYNVDFDITQSIGKRYRRQDEIGTPYCITVDFDSLEDKAVTVRDRDTMKQERIAISDLETYFAEKLS
ncbi:MAG: Glycine-tRNA ligase [Candidatus Uhrbacteria bacterium GW2011_GWD2_41_121]|uniref:Glycine--tRNA ligase n=1 Tax=Candidatus Uhrbacteria bacterium GW2011_GWC1_41_20 TaxID=1618983 RepID=A0A0G0VFJ8_9BACT|nr:MAG: Glycine-tRNA ligase [Candidatus Uhrbacteria bacterium GW2011_GWE1_39_46]KKR64284.1 MAG: Glycine-tRNA ligase [Candidatus Uhrbacteria bacterium GW2011_GWC2_40_450]KKR90454.1 MAG: Glycine-tRNA ligase [Candidatus Uhrbacteria bacterium GW2011_GWD2_41_121]KKR96183.1 MAG: Glycine-tRNA ligase [Candidatus Uhrbacteria bacterium GW2011_GWD1_41_16]KKR99719.1 MAG: Glycine-tRNA ligase [Candidatus Uhrbacteria bacterium GW2011_GWC1_41_20]KKS06292.1 MAG: Glycine-tRNA ligase [Candidatus Uhrbacteria bact